MTTCYPGLTCPLPLTVAVSGKLCLVVDDGALAKLTTDHQRVVYDGFLLDDAEPFDDLMSRCEPILQKANAKASAKKALLGSALSPMTFAHHGVKAQSLSRKSA